MSIAPSATGAIPVFAQKFGSWRISVSRDAFARKELGDRYDRAASTWDRALTRMKVRRAYYALFAELRETYPQRFGATSKITSLDCGAGTGAFSASMAQVFEGYLEAHAVDLSPNMLKIAKNRMTESGRRLKTDVADIGHLPYSDGKFDLSMAAHALEHMPDPSKGLQEMVRVTRTHGLVLVCFSRRSFASRLLQLKWRHHLMTPQSGIALMKSAGLKRVRRLQSPDCGRFQDLSLVFVGEVP